MNPIKKAAVQPTAHTNTEHKRVYHTKQQTAIAKRRAAMVKSHRATYDKAVSGTSLRAAITSFCQECNGDSVEYIRECTDLGCPLYSVRPYQRMSQSTLNEGFDDAESTNDVKGVV